MIIDNFDEMLEQSRAPAAGDGHRAASLPRRPALPAAPPAARAASTWRARATRGAVWFTHARRDSPRTWQARWIA